MPCRPESSYAPRPGSERYRLDPGKFERLPVRRLLHRFRNSQRDFHFAGLVKLVFRSRRFFKGTIPAKVSRLNAASTIADFILVHGHGRADRAGVPDAGRRRRALHAHAIAHDRPAAHESNSRDQPLQHARVAASPSDPARSRKDQTDTRNWPSPQSGKCESRRMDFLLAPPSGGQRKQLGDGEFQRGNFQQVPVYGERRHVVMYYMHVKPIQAFLLSYPFPEPIRLPFYGGERTILKRDAMLIRVEPRQGLVGYAPGPGSERVHRAIRDVVAPFLEGMALADPDALRVKFETGPGIGDTIW